MARPWEIKTGDAVDVLRTMEPGSVQCVVTSPPYWGLRDYGIDGQLGLESTPGEYVEKIVTVLDPFNGAGTTGVVALRLGRRYVGIELNPEYVALAERRLIDEQGRLGTLAPEDVADIEGPLQFGLLDGEADR